MLRQRSRCLHRNVRGYDDTDQKNIDTHPGLATREIVSPKRLVVLQPCVLLSGDP